MSAPGEAIDDLSRPSVQLEGVTKRFGDFPAVRDLSLDIAAGEFFTLLGPSGCGKTTTLRMVAGFEQPTAGRILIDGVDVEGVPPFKRPTNTVFQSYALFPHLSVEDNVAFGLRRKRVAKDEVRRRVREELERVGLAAEAKRKPRQLSGGQQQRVALARALINRPAVLLLDEPLGALDLKLRKGLQVELKRIQRDVGITFVYVTHDQEEALTMSDRIAVMNRGRDRAARRSRGGVRAAGDRVRGRVHRRVEPAPGRGRVGQRRRGRPAARQRPHGPHARAAGVARGERCHAVVRPEKLRVAQGGGARARPGSRASRASSSRRSTSAPPRRWSCCWPATCGSRCSCRTRTRPSARRCPGPARACA